MIGSASTIRCTAKRKYDHGHWPTNGAERRVVELHYAVRIGE
jgi:hypothetical protein